MNNRERIINTVSGRKVDRLPFFVPFALCPWEPTKRNWEKQGCTDGEKWEECLAEQLGFRLDEGFKPIEVNLGFYPFFEEEVIEDLGDKHIIRDKYGVLQEAKKDKSVIPYFLDYPIKSMEDWQVIKKERLNPDSRERFPGNWDDLVREYNDGAYAIQIGQYPYGLFGTIRDFMGVEEMLVSFYTQPELIKDMMDYLTDFWLSIYEKVCKKVKIDHIHMWEDMSGCQGSLISPAMVQEFMIPNYKKIRKFADAHGIEIFSVDTDGRVDELVPLFVEAGVNLIFPFEVAAGSDILKYGEKYPELCILGGLDKRALGLDRAAIDMELGRISPMFKRGRYILSMDHGIPPEVTWENLKYYFTQARKYIGGEL